MYMPKEHDYIGLSETSPMEKTSANHSSPSSSSTKEGKKKSTCMNLKETELRLGLPGSESPERKPAMPATGVSLFGREIDCDGYSLSPSKNCVSGAKRVFSDAINGSSAKWVFSGSDVDLSKGAVLFSPRPANGNILKSSVAKEAAAVISQSLKAVQEKNNQVSGSNLSTSAPAAKAQIVGWPPIQSFRKNNMASSLVKKNEETEGKSGIGCLYVKVSMDGVPYLRKVDLKTYTNYIELSSALEKMFSCFTIGQCGSHGLSETRLKDLLNGCEYVVTYEDKDSDWMLVGDVPWEMFTDTCRRLRIMKGSEAIGLAPREMEKCKDRCS